MEIKRLGHKYTVVPQKNGSYMTVMILSIHDNFDDAIDAVFAAMKKESEEIMNRKIEKMRKQGIQAVSFKEAMKDMTPEERARFMEERNRKFINPIIDMNSRILEQKRKELQQRRKENSGNE